MLAKGSSDYNHGVYFHHDYNYQFHCCVQLFMDLQVMLYAEVYKVWVYRLYGLIRLGLWNRNMHMALQINVGLVVLAQIKRGNLALFQI